MGQTPFLNSSIGQLWQPVRYSDGIDIIEIIDCTCSLIQTEITAMASITIRNLDDEIKQRLSVRAAVRGHSMEEEARDILRRFTSEGSAPRNLAAAIRARVAPADRLDLALPVRQPMP
jgi:plasmid stability protein